MAEEEPAIATAINTGDPESLTSPFSETSPDIGTPESTARGSGSDRGYLADDDGELSSNRSSAPGDNEDADPLIDVSSRSSCATSDRKSKSPTRKPLFQPASSLSSVKKLVFGLFIVVVIAVTWVGSTQTAKSTYNGKFRSPFFIVWFGTSFMVLVFPVSVPFYFLLNRKCINWSNIREFWRHCSEIITPRPFSPLALLTSTVLFSLIWIPTNYLYVRALITIPATDVTALFSTAPAFVFIFSMIILREPPLLMRFISVLLAVSGIVLFAYVDGFGSANTRGVLMSVGSAVGAALYKTLLKWRVKESSLYQMSLFLSSIGVFSTLVLWPVVVLLHVSGAEMLLEIPWIYLLASSILSILFNFAINFGIAYTFPLFISLGTIMGVPLNAVFDAFIRHVDLLNWKITAMDLIIGAFLLMLAPPSLSEWIERKLYCRRGSKCY